jgi:hypothetical protein
MLGRPYRGKTRLLVRPNVDMSIERLGDVVPLVSDR